MSTHPPPTLHNGWDCFFTEPGMHAVTYCRVCSEVMDVRRGVVGAISWAHSMAMKAGSITGTLHDEFFCPHAGEGWHRQALALRRQADKVPSKRLADAYTREADEIVRTRTATKAVPD